MKFRTVYVCQNCGYKTPKWLGQCPDCSAWNTLAEEVVAEPTKKEASSKKALTNFSSEITSLKDAQIKTEQRLPSGVKEFDRLVCGGLVEGQLTLLAGAPGIGKSTLMLQVAARLAETKKVLYISGEESLSQISARAKRLGVKGDGLLLLSETDMQAIIEAVENVKPQVLIIDSIQTVYHPQLTSSAGTIGQVRENAGEILRLCKPKGIIVFLLGHVTKDGALAGPKVLEHMVDTVLYFDTEKDNILRLLRAHKNRFGSTSETALFKMTATGLEDVEDASSYFAQSSRSKNLAGRAYSICAEGTRPILTEVQALVSPTRYPFPRRISTGFDLNRAQMLLAALERHVGVNLESKDVYISLAGGVKINDSALDLAVCAAVISAARDIALSGDKVFLGEVGILGQTALVPMLERRVEEARRLGLDKIYTPVLSAGLKKALAGKVSEVGDIFTLASLLKPKAPKGI